MKSSKSRREWEKKIVQITLKIHRKYPELTKYLDEMPDQMEAPSEADISDEMLKEYHDSLEELLADYAKTHAGKRQPKTADKA